MASFFDDTMHDALPLIHSVFGETITNYTSADGTVVANVVISLGHIEEREQVNENRPGKLKVRQRVFNLLRQTSEPAWLGLQQVDLQGHFTIGGEKWAVAEITAKTAHNISGTLAAHGYVAMAPRGTYRR